MSQISYTFLRNNHTKHGRISIWTREQPGTTRKEKMMGDYTEHLISMAGGNGEPSTVPQQQTKYIVIVENQYTQTATLAKLDLSGRHYQETGKGKYSDLLDIARQLNGNPKP